MKSAKAIPIPMPESARPPAAPEKVAAPAPARDWRPLAAGAVLVGLVVVTYLPAIGGDFLWDDDVNVTNNETLRSRAGLWRMWCEPRSVQQYYPLMYTSYWVEYHLWGLAPAGYHVVNILLHALAVVLLWRVLKNLAVPGAWLGALFFAVHPVEVESVAWITERKNVLSLSLALLSMLCYFRFSTPEPAKDDGLEERHPAAWGWYTLALALFALALAAKTVVVTMPAVLLVIRWWQRGRITTQDVLYTLPMFALSLASGAMTWWMETAVVGAQGKEFALAPLGRLLLAGRALWFYAAKLACPYPLPFFYPRWQIDTRVWWQYLFPIIALATPAALWLARGRIGRGPLAAVLIFSGVLMPALGFFNIYYTRFAYVSDHFQYHASIALLALAAAGITLLERRLSAAGTFRAATAAVILLLAGLSFKQTFTYHDLETLYRDAIAKNPNCWVAYQNLSAYLETVDRDEEAITLIREAMRLSPNDPKMYAGLGNLLGKNSQNPQAQLEARRAYLESVRVDPDYCDGWISLGFSAMRDQLPEAREYFERALALVPEEPHALYGLGGLAGMAGQWSQAEVYFQRALQRDPTYVDPRRDLVAVLLRQGKKAEAIVQLEVALQINQNRPEMHFELANLLIEENQLNEAARHYAEAVRQRPDYFAALENLGAALLKMGDVDRALPYLIEASRLQPDHPQARANLEQARVMQRQRGDATTVRPASEAPQ